MSYNTYAEVSSGAKCLINAYAAEFGGARGLINASTCTDVSSVARCLIPPILMYPVWLDV